MSEPVSLQEKREAKRKAGLDKKYNRECDAEIQLWLDDDGRVGQVFHTLADATDFGEQGLGYRRLIKEAMWMVCGDRVETDKADYSMAATIMLDNDGYINFAHHQNLVRGTNWRHARWFLRQWWRVTKWWWKLAWRMWRHPEPWKSDER